MVEPILEHVGSRIRLYRKKSGMNLEELAAKVHKSRASICKYELGQIAVDIVTLFDISRALGVTLFQLFDYAPPGQSASGAVRNPFGPADELYMYHMNKNKVHFSILRLGPANNENHTTATLFYKLADPDNLERCDCIYHGLMYGHEMVLSLILRNYHIAVENILLNFSIPMRQSAHLTGMICGLGVNTMAPTANKVLLAATRLPVDDELKAELRIQPETFREMKKNNSLFVPLG